MIFDNRRRLVKALIKSMKYYPEQWKYQNSIAENSRLNIKIYTSKVVEFVKVYRGDGTIILSDDEKMGFFPWQRFLSAAISKYLIFLSGMRAHEVRKALRDLGDMRMVGRE